MASHFCSVQLPTHLFRSPHFLCSEVLQCSLTHSPPLAMLTLAKPLPLIAITTSKGTAEKNL